jgi:membrane protein
MAHILNESNVAMMKLPLAVLRTASDSWIRDRCISHAASVAFFALFSLAPMLILIITVAGYGLSSSDVADQIFYQLQIAIGANAAESIKATVSAANLSEWGSSATIFSLTATLIGASATFTELKSALNTIFLGTDNQDAPFAHATWAFFRARILSGALVVGIGVLLMAAVLAEGVATFLEPHFAPSVSQFFLPVLNLLRIDALTSTALLAASFTVLLVVLPDAKIRWREALIGALVGTALFVAGKYAFGYYLRAAGTANAFGAAGSAAVTLMWMFYSAAVFLFSAEVLKVIQTENVLNLPIPKPQKAQHEN